MIAYEAAVLWYALASWRAGPEVPSTGDVFTVHRRSAYGAVVAALLLAAAAEIVPAHVLLGVWSEPVAWGATALSAYGVLWLVGDWRAMRLRPVVVVGDRVVLRLGLRWSLAVRLDRIQRMEVRGGGAAVDPAPELEMALPGAPRLVIRFRNPVEARGIYGMRKVVRSVEVGVDEAERLVRLLEEQIG